MILDCLGNLRLRYIARAAPRCTGEEQSALVVMGMMRSDVPQPCYLSNALPPGNHNCIGCSVGCHLTSKCCLQTTVIEEDKEFVHSYFDMPDEDFPVHRQSPWLLRITLNRDLMVDKKLSLEAIAERINTEFEDELHCIFNDDNAEVPALRVSPVPSQFLESPRLHG